MLLLIQIHIYLQMDHTWDWFVPWELNIPPLSHIVLMMVQTTALSPRHTMYTHVHAHRHTHFSLEKSYATGRRSH